FDSLMEAGGPEAWAAARALTVGPARRLFPLLAEAQARLAPFLDTALSRDSILSETRRGDSAVPGVRTPADFRTPLLGMERRESAQAVHLCRDAAGWRIADFEELADDARAAPRTGTLADDARDSGTDSYGRGEATALLPVSSRA